MFFILSKVLFYIVMPLFWILAALIYAVFTKKEHRRKKALIFSTVLLLFFTNPFLSNEAWLLWEHPPSRVKNGNQYDAAIILTGLTNQNKSPHDRIYTGQGADRFLHPLWLYKEGMVRKFIISGGSGSLFKKHSTEAAEIKKLLMYSGVPAEDIIVEDKSRNTHENAMFTKEVLNQHPEMKKLLLVTSAFHMRRASACFVQEGVQADVFSTDFHTTDRIITPISLLIPQEVHLYHWNKLLHEILGYVVYDIIGYL